MKLKAYNLVWCFVAAICLLFVSVPVMARDYLYVPCNNNLHVVDCQTDTVVETIEYNDYIVACAPSPDGKRVYLNSFRKIYEVDTETNEIVDIHNFYTDLNRVYIMPDFEVSNDGRYLYLSTRICKKKMNIPRLNVLPPQLLVYDLQKKQVVKTFELPNAANGVFAIRGDSDHLIIFGMDIWKFNLNNGKLDKIMGILNPEGDNPGLNSLVVWDNRAPGDHGISVNPAYSATDLYYVLINRNNGEVSKVKGEDVVFEYSAIVSPDKKYIYGVMDEVYKIDFKTGKTLAATACEQGTNYAIQVTSDGKKVYVGPAGPNLTIYDTSNMKQIGVIPLKGDGVTMTRISK